MQRATKKLRIEAPNRTFRNSQTPLLHPQKPQEPSM